MPSRKRDANTGGNSTSASMPSSSCSRSRCAASPAPSFAEPSGLKYDATSKLMGPRPVMFWPLRSIGRPPIISPPPPWGNEMRRGARSCHWSGTYFVHTGGVSTCPSAEITWYLRAMVALLLHSRRRDRIVGADAQVPLEVAVRVDDAALLARQREVREAGLAQAALHVGRDAHVGVEHEPEVGFVGREGDVERPRARGVDRRGAREVEHHHLRALGAVAGPSDDHRQQVGRDEH